jgi:pescadillo protein
MHEPLLAKFRDLKVYLRRHTRLIGRREEHLAERLQRPSMNLNHLIRERYPTFIDALRDMDDPYSTLFLFRGMKLHLARAFDAARVNNLERLCGEWLHTVAAGKFLRKAFISIKGFYFQANVKGQQITWLVPHQVMQNTPKDVDYNIMSTFVQFYESLAKFVTFKVAKDEGLEYPPLIGDDGERAQVKAVFGALTAAKDAKLQNKQQKKGAAVAMAGAAGKKQAASVKVSDAAAAGDAAESAADAAETAAAAANAATDAAGDTGAFHALDPEALPLMDALAAKQAAVFRGLTFLVSREVPFEPVAFVIRAGGGVALSESFITAEQAKAAVFTHQVVDRPKLLAFLPSRRYVQPQWVFDCFNERHVLPTEPYGVGAKLPPHLSPFVNDEKAGYVPEQRNVLRRWAGLAPVQDGAKVKLGRQVTQEELEAAKDAEDEAEYAKGMAQEAKAAKIAAKQEAKASGKKAAAAAAAAPAADKKAAAASKKGAKAAAPAAADDEEEQEEFEFDASDIEAGSDDDDADEEEEDYEIDGDIDGVDRDEIDSASEDEGENEDEEDAAPLAHPQAPRPDAFNNRNTERELAKMMLKRRHSYLINEKDRKARLKAEKSQVLQIKRDAHAAGIENPALPKVHRKRPRA